MPLLLSFHVVKANREHREDIGKCVCSRHFPGKCPSWVDIIPKKGPCFPQGNWASYSLLLDSDKRFNSIQISVALFCTWFLMSVLQLTQIFSDWSLFLNKIFWCLLISVNHIAFIKALTLLAPFEEAILFWEVSSPHIGIQNCLLSYQFMTQVLPQPFGYRTNRRAQKGSSMNLELKLRKLQLSWTVLSEPSSYCRLKRELSAQWIRKKIQHVEETCEDLNDFNP